MSKENAELLNSMGVDERLDYAEKLVFGLDGIDQDLSAGMHVIKTEANNANSKAELLMYKINMTKGKNVSAMNWLKRAYDQGNGEALAMAWFEKQRGRFKWYKDKELMTSLKKAVSMDVPVANYFMGIVAENDNKLKEAEEYYSKAVELGFEDNYLDFTEYKEEYRKLDMVDLRGIFQRNYLPSLFVEYHHVHLGAVNEERLDKLIQDMWNEMLEKENKNPEDYPFEFSAETYIDDDEKTCYTLIQMPELPKSKGRNIAIYAIGVFDIKEKRRPRCFLGETDYNSLCRCIFVCEPEWKNENYEHHNYGMLGLPYNPVKKEDELYEFVQYALRVYREQEGGKLGAQIKRIFRKK